jgi:hypothetical protein
LLVIWSGGLLVFWWHLWLDSLSENELVAVMEALSVATPEPLFDSLLEIEWERMACA